MPNIFYMNQCYAIHLTDKLFRQCCPNYWFKLQYIIQVIHLFMYLFGAYTVYDWLMFTLTFYKWTKRKTLKTDQTVLATGENLILVTDNRSWSTNASYVCLHIFWCHKSSQRNWLNDWLTRRKRGTKRGTTIFKGDYSQIAMSSIFQWMLVGTLWKLSLTGSVPCDKGCRNYNACIWHLPSLIKQRGKKQK